MDIKKETLNYLGYNGQSLTDKEDQQIDDAIAEVVEVSNPKTTHRVFPVTREGDKLSIPADLDLNYSDLVRLLSDSHQVLIIAATLGLELDRRLRYYAKTDASRLVLMDAAASALVERVCDDFQEALPFRKYTFRFSPGYGDVPLVMQKQIVRVLDTQRQIGMTLTRSLMMIPQKSITGIVGIGGRPIRRSCEDCALFGHCEFRKRGTVCYATNDTTQDKD
ncbi:MAG: hypothetical protein JW780_04175 [Clostridiales bacterium]|nr:hypothetical protein [Clostridiales bacterium]